MSDHPAHPYWYARVIGIFHCMVHHHGHSSEPKRMDFLWVRWLGLDTVAPGGWDRKRLHSVGFIPEDDPAAFGFLDPEQIVRGVHLIPAFARGHTSKLLGPRPNTCFARDGNGLSSGTLVIRTQTLTLTCDW